MKFIYPPGATAIDGDEAEALIPRHITLQSELNEWEQTNIQEAEKWSFGQRHADILSIEFIKKLHLKMFDETWKWAGRFRKTLKNIGVVPHDISQELLKFCVDAQVQIDEEVYPFDEIAARLHHRLVWIHPFPNGNGRHARIFTDIFLVHNKQQRFTWGREDLASFSETRKKYIEALREADKHNFDPLFKFVRS